MYYQVGFISIDGDIEIKYDNIPSIEEAELLAQRVMWCNRRINPNSKILGTKPVKAVIIPITEEVQNQLEVFKATEVLHAKYLV